MKLSKEDIKENLDYIGLNIEKIPKIYKECEVLNYKSSRPIDDNKYRVYKHVNINEIQILISKTNRLDSFNEKLKQAAPLTEYLDSKSDENIERYQSFLKMIKDIDIKKIDRLEIKQNMLKEKSPVDISYTDDFIWQVYYSEKDGKYFMIAPANESDNSALFYLIKRQLINKTKKKAETIFIPVSQMDYSTKILNRQELTDLETYIWYFTKEWASVYEVYDIKNEPSMKIVGEFIVYDKIKSKFVLSLEDKNEAIETYKLLKAMFILSNGMPNEYKFYPKISLFGSLAFTFKDRTMKFEELAEFLKEEYVEKTKRIEHEIKQNKKLVKRLKRFNNLIEELTQEYLIRQKQISTFLDCKKTFIGRVKFFFKKKKEIPIVTSKEFESERDLDKADEELKAILEIKDNYTIEDLIAICDVLEKKQKENKNIELDIEAIEAKKEILSRKIENADIYIKEIDKHKKSIFEFWKFTSKDETQNLAEGKIDEEENNATIKKVYDYEDDYLALGEYIDTLQRRKLSKDETDAVYSTKYALNSYKVKFEEDGKAQNLEEIDKHLNRILVDYQNDIEEVEVIDFDIFGGLGDKTASNEINNTKHREIKKDKYKVLNIKKDTLIEYYNDTINKHTVLLKEAFNKIKAPYDIPVYLITTKKTIDETVVVCELNPQKIINDMINTRKETITIAKINIKKDMPILFFSNIIMYDNSNKTLPVGMDLSSEVLVNLKDERLKFETEKSFNVNYKIDDYNSSLKRIKVYEYELK